MNEKQQAIVARRVCAIIFFGGWALIGGLPLDHTTLFWVILLSFWVVR